MPRANEARVYSPDLLLLAGESFSGEFQDPSRGGTSSASSNYMGSIRFKWL